MEKHLLLAVGDDASCLYGVRFLCSFFQHKNIFQITLCYIASYSGSCPMPGQTGLPGSHERVEKRVADQYLKKGHASVDESRALLTSKGFHVDKITSTFRCKRFGTVKDLVREGRKGRYDAVLLGRRGYSLFEQALASSVSREMLDQEIDFPVWVCRHPEEGRKNVLLCVDQTEPSLRIADHVGFMLEPETSHDITVLHVAEGDSSSSDRILEEVSKTLLENGISQDRIHTRVVHSSHTADTILAEAERGTYAVVAMGRGGGPAPKGIFGKWLMGSRSLKVFETLTKSVLWLSK